MMERAPASTPAVREASPRRKRIVRRRALGVWAALLAAYLGALIVTGRGPVDLLVATGAFLSGAPLGPAVYLAAYALRPLALLSAAVLTVAAGVLYGPVVGFALAAIGANLSALVAYGLGRALGDEIAGRSPTRGWQAGLLERLRTRTFETVLTLRFLFVPYDAVNYLAGATRLRVTPFLVATILGSLPGTVTFVLFGAGLGDLSELAAGRLPSPDPWLLGVSAALFVVSLAGARWLRRRDAGS
jgi:uncharacterized membrane protein YdjX (TVP38/TMEM64 family)